MPRKPSSVFVIVSPAGANGQATAYREPLVTGDEEELEAIVTRHYHQHSVGTTIFVIEDTKPDAYRIGLTLEPIEDARLLEEDDLG